MQKYQCSKNFIKERQNRLKLVLFANFTYSNDAYTFSLFDAFLEMLSFTVLNDNQNIRIIFLDWYSFLLPITKGVMCK